MQRPAQPWQEQFWEKVYNTVLKAGHSPKMASTIADEAVRVLTDLIQSHSGHLN